MAKIRFGLIGCGRILPKHAQALKGLEAEAEIAAVCDINLDKAQKVAQQLGVPAYSDFHEMIAKERLDAVNVLTWSGTHSPIAIECAGKVRNIVVEKPMSLRLDHADNLIEACRKTNTRLFVVKQNRYNPPVVAMRNALESGRFGRLLMGTVRVRWARTPEYYRQDAWRGTWALDGGALTNQASHFIDMLVWFFGPVKSVYAKTATFLAPIESEDTGIAVLEFENGALGVIEATTCTRPKDLEGSISILGEKGTVELSGFAANQVRTWSFQDQRPEDAEIHKTATNPPNVYGFGHQDFLRHVVRCIRENVPAMIDGVEGRRSLELIHAIYESAALKKEVFLKDLNPIHSPLGRRS
jgi:UDP-N-acetyl-2-amino-2-deoxyglucuronate dehydrogenase